MFLSTFAVDVRLVGYSGQDAGAYQWVQLTRVEIMSKQWVVTWTLYENTQASQEAFDRENNGRRQEATNIVETLSAGKDVTYCKDIYEAKQYDAPSLTRDEVISYLEDLSHNDYSILSSSIAVQRSQR